MRRLKAVVICLSLAAGCGLESRSRSTDGGSADDGGDARVDDADTPDANERLDAGGTRDAGDGGPPRCDNDCDDGDPCTIDVCINVTRLCMHHVASEICDAVDNDCDGAVDEDDNCTVRTCEFLLAAVCDPNALCTEAPDGAHCECPVGFVDLSGGTDTGIACADIDECRAMLSDCDDNATCTNTLGAFECSCNEGYSGDGFTCVP